MPYKDQHVRKEYHKKQYQLRRKQLERLCPVCKVRYCVTGKTCRGCSKGGQGINWARKIVRDRDCDTCQKCGLVDWEIMEVDHKLPIKDHPELYTDPNNMWLLCPNCHKRKTIHERQNN